ncbi:DUF2304 domain-containing protein [Enterococcus italicus]|uniref:DUF2304 domain-containing protein n=1 Tax=Enterococcus italicus TaxID=246144 RepID=UPI00207328DD|nr:DUF2304 domain-containing protein [Enterococcus italicus]
MPIQLQIIAVIFATCYFIMTVKLIKSDSAEIYQMNKWLFLSVILVIGALFPGFGTFIAHILGVTTLTSLALYILTAFLIIVSVEYQIELSKKKKQLKKLTQVLSIMNKKIY